jgi:hypothetical protein
VSRRTATGMEPSICHIGAVLVRTYKSRTLHVRVLTQGFEFEGTRYPSLSAVAKAVTGCHCNGFLFFRLARQGEQP